MDQDCSIYRTMNFIGKRWTLLILLELYKEDCAWKRYSHIKKKLPGITSKILAARLRELKEEEMIEKKVDTTVIPFKSEYKLTESGEYFVSLAKEIKKWSLKYKYKNKVCEAQNCRHCDL